MASAARVRCIPATNRELRQSVALPLYAEEGHTTDVATHQPHDVVREPGLQQFCNRAARQGKEPLACTTLKMRAQTRQGAD